MARSSNGFSVAGPARRRARFRSWHLYALLAGTALVPWPALSADLLPEQIESIHVQQNVGTLIAEVEQIRAVLGKRAPRARTFKLADAEPRQVFVQAQTLFRKCNHLAREVAGVSRQRPDAAPEGEITSAEVFALIDAARDQLNIVREAIGINIAAEVPRLKRRADSADVMHDIIEAGYVLNRLIVEQNDWADIYERVTQMIAYLGGALPEATRYPPLPRHECCKDPQQVYAKLLEAMERLRPLAESVDLSLIKVIPGKQAEGGASTATVYDLTTTMLWDLAELTLRMEIEDAAIPQYDRPARLYPSHVWQLASALHMQIDLLTASEG